MKPALLYYIIDTDIVVIGLIDNIAIPTTIYYYYYIMHNDVNTNQREREREIPSEREKALLIYFIWGRCLQRNLYNTYPKYLKPITYITYIPIGYVPNRTKCVFE